MDQSDGDARDRLHASRRRLMAVMGAVVSAGLAGCTEVTQQSFEAAPVVLPEDDQSTLMLPETGSDSTTVDREYAGGNVEVGVTSHLRVYRRAPGLGAN